MAELKKRVSLINKIKGTVKPKEDIILQNKLKPEIK
jgi:hypothetical protein